MMGTQAYIISHNNILAAAKDNKHIAGKNRIINHGQLSRTGNLQCVQPSLSILDTSIWLSRTCQYGSQV